MAKAATWSSPMLRSVRPRTIYSISAVSSRWPSRFLRMISCGKKRPLVSVIAPLAVADMGFQQFAFQRLQKDNQQPLEIFGGKFRLLQRQLVAERDFARPGNGIGDAGNGKDAQARVPGDEDFRGCRHADGIRAEQPKGANLGRCLEIRAKVMEINALMKRDPELFCDRRQMLSEDRVIGILHREEARPELPLIGTDQRIQPR